MHVREQEQQAQQEVGEMITDGGDGVRRNAWLRIPELNAVFSTQILTVESTSRAIFTRSGAETTAKSPRKQPREGSY